jgi:NAD(P)-dependent dehydrogenase (short-subunit alcohol dehydrogenase family)
MSRVADKVVLVTGAGSGIGRATAKLLRRGRHGDRDRHQQAGRAGDRAADRRQGALRGARHRREEDWKRIIDGVMAREGGSNGLVNNAGIAGPFPSTFETETVEQWRRMLSINVEGVFLGCKYGVPAMRQSGGGSIVNTSSLAAFLGTPALSGLRRQQGGRAAIYQDGGHRLRAQGLQGACNSVHPGIIMTPMGDAVMPSDKARERSRRRIPIGEFGAPEDIAYGILYLISDESRFVTGAELVIDGGMNAI